MMKKHIFLLAAFMCGTAWAEEDNSLFFTDAAVKPGDVTNIELCMANTATDLTCIEAEIQLPEGLSVVCDEEGNPVSTLYLNRSKKHEITANVLENGNLKLLVSSIDGSLLEGEEGPLLSFCVQADETAPRGACTVETVGETLLVNTVAEAYYNVGVTGNVLITDDPTSVVTIDHSPLTNGHYFNLAGQRVSKAKSGIFIRDGKKKLHR